MGLAFLAATGGQDRATNEEPERVAPALTIEGPDPTTDRAGPATGISQPENFIARPPLRRRPPRESSRAARSPARQSRGRVCAAARRGRVASLACSRPRLCARARSRLVLAR